MMFVLNLGLYIIQNQVKILIIIRIIVWKVSGSLEVYAAMVKSELILRIADANLQLPLKDV